MKKVLLLVTIGLLAFHSLSAQVARTRKPLSADQQPLIIVDSVVTDFNHFLLQPESIVDVDVLSDSAAMSIYGEKAKYGVIIIRTRKNAEIMQLNDLLNFYNIPEEDRNLKVCVNNVMVKDSQKLIASKSDISTVEVIKDICWISPAEAGPEERYINIVTRRKK